MKHLRQIAIVFLGLAVMVSSVTMVQARHQARAVGEMVICSGLGMVTVAVDADGNPTGPMLPCPECVVAMAGLADAAVILPLPALTLVALRHLSAEHPAPQTGRSVHIQPRAPPVVI
jgi:hypothetical protein